MTSAAVLAEAVDQSAPQGADFTEQIRKPAHIAHVRTLIVAGGGAELGQVDASSSPHHTADIH